MVAFAALGLAVGAILNVFIDKIPRKEGFLEGRVCQYCGHPYDRLDWLASGRLFVRGVDCQSCGRHVFVRAVVAEMMTAMLFGFLWIKEGPSLNLALFSFYFSIFVVLFFIDLEHRRVPNIIILPSVIMAVVSSFLYPGFVPAVVGGVVGFCILLALYLVNPRGIGAGDVKLAALIGLLAGWPAVIVGLLTGFLLGGLGALILLITRVVNRRSFIPYAPFLIAGAMVAMLYGNEIVSWYLSHYIK